MVSWKKEESQSTNNGKKTNVNKEPACCGLVSKRLVNRKNDLTTATQASDFVCILN